MPSDVRLKLDFITKLEEMLVPGLIKKNIALVITLGNKFMTMIEGMVVMVEKNLNFQKEKGTQVSLKAFMGWMKRFIVTNYEIFLDHFKSHSEFVAQRYFNKELISQNAQYMIKHNMQEEKIALGAQ